MIPNFDYDTLINAFKSGKLDHASSLNDFVSQYRPPKLRVLNNNN